MGNILSEAPKTELSGLPSIAGEREAELEILPQKVFLRRLFLERKRTERSRRRFILMLLKCGSLFKTGSHGGVADRIAHALSNSTRETDVTGWYRHGSILGVIFTEIGEADGKCVANALLTKVTNALSSSLRIEQIREIILSFHVFPEDWDDQQPGDPDHSTIVRDFGGESELRHVALSLKRVMDIIGSASATLLLLPLLLAIGALVKATSQGPMLFRQVRIGQYGRRFTFLKFRSMYISNDHTIHKEYIKSFIAGKTEGDDADRPQTYKLRSDPRITPIGRFLRRTSLDELPQLLNVLKGDMSLVGPRPPVPYEFECYDIWHRQRLLGVKPGITGLWQVEGRSRVKFDEMVRLDLRYARSWSLWLDIKILLKTPRAVVSGAGAY
jgi:lipopolysaccharide/colanic/teichoic acid biosynthesis glycosyltransferase